MSELTMDRLRENLESLKMKNTLEILDRVLHHCTVINIKGESYRLKERKECMRPKQIIVYSLVV